MSIATIAFIFLGLIVVLVLLWWFFKGQMGAAGGFVNNVEDYNALNNTRKCQFVVKEKNWLRTSEKISTCGEYFDRKLTICPKCHMPQI